MRDTHRAVLYNYPGRSPQTACKAQPFTGRTLAAQGRKPRRRHQPSSPQGRVNLREYSKHRFLPKAYCLRGRRPQAAFILAPQGAHLPSGAVIYNSRGRSPQTACKAQPFTGRTLAAQGRKPRRLPQPSRRSRVNLREYSQAPPSLPKSPSPRVSHTAKKH